MAESNVVVQTSTKPWYESYKFIVTMVVVVLIFATVLTLALTGQAEVTAEQIFSLGKWIITTLTSGHVLQRIGESAAAAFASRSTDAGTTPAAPAEDGGES